MIAIVLIVLFVIYIIRRDKKRLGKLISPSICFLLPTFFVALLYDIIGPHLGFYSLNKSIYHELLFGAFFFFIGGETACNLKLPWLRLDQYKLKLLNVEKTSLQPRIYIIIACVVILLFLRLYSLGGLNVLFSEDLQSQYGSSGLFGHLLVFSIFSITLLLSLHFSDSRKRLSYVLMFCCFVSVLFYQVKSWFIFPILVSVLYKQNIGVKQSFFKYLVVILVIIICFILGYAFTYSLNDTENQLFILNHFFKYFFAGVGGWSEALNEGFITGQNPAYILQPFSHFLGIEQAGVDARYEFVLINDNGEYTNVFTLIGTSLLFAGRFVAYIYFFFLGLFSYLLACKCIKSPKIGVLLAYSILCTSLFLGFFGSYFTLLNIYELIFYSFVIQYFVRRMDVGCLYVK